MCGRFALTLPQSAAREHFQARRWPEPETSAALGPLEAIDRPRYNIRPTETILTVARDAEGARALRPMRWGFLPHWCASPNDGTLLINARGETLAEKPAFKKAAREHRCLIPADGFFEWRVVDTGRSGARGKPIVEKTPYWIQPVGGDGVAFAGVWREWTAPNGATIPTVAIVTCAANEAMSALHHRLPVAIAPENYGLWLGEEGRGAALLMRAPAASFYAFHIVSKAINVSGRAAPDGPELIAPASSTEDGPRDDAPRLI